MKLRATLMLILISFISFAQDDQIPMPENYISLSAGLQTADFGKPVFGIAYKRALNEKWWFKTGFSYNTFQGENLMKDSLLHADNSIQIYRDQEQYNKSYLVNTGIQYNPIRYLNFGVALVVGYNRGHASLTDHAKTYDSPEGVWVWDQNALRDEYPDLFVSNYDQTSGSSGGQYNGYLGHATYMVTGGSVEIGGRMPVGKKWEIGLTYTTSYLRYTYLNNHSLATELNYEGMEVYPNIENIVTELPSFNLWNHLLSLSVGLGF